MTIDPLFVDVYAGDGPKNWRAFCAAGPPWHGAIFKCSQGNYYQPPQYAAERNVFLTAAGSRHGVDLFDGAYHYLDLGIDGSAQADYAVAAVARAGGERRGTLWMMVDVERGGQRIKDPSRALVEDRVGTFAWRYLALTGRRATLYGGELIRTLGISDRMGCERSAVALYGGQLHGANESTEQFLARTGTDLAHLLLWQYRGTDVQAFGPAGYPMDAPGCGVVDISVLTWPGGLPALRSGLWSGATVPPTKLAT